MRAQVPAAIAIGLLLGVACWASAVDRLSGRHPEFATLVPELFAVAAIRAQATVALEESRSDEALGLARRAVARDPVDPASTPLLGAALLLAGRPREAETAMRVAAQVGWRVSLTQLYWVESARAGGQFDVASKRLDAVLRQDPLLASRHALLGRLEAEPGGREALVRRLAEAPAWTLGYAREIGELSPTQARQRVEVLRRLGHTGHAIGCDAAAAMAISLALTNPARARALWRLHCPRAARAGLVADGGFAAIDRSRPAPPFEWQFPPAEIVDLVISAEAGFSDQALSASNGGDREAVVAWQHVALPAGAWRLRWRATGGAHDSGVRIAPRIICATAAAIPPAALPGGIGRQGDHYVVDFVQPVACPQARLEIVVAPTRGFASIDDVTLVPDR